MLAVCGQWEDLNQKYAPQIRRELEDIRACQAHTTWREMREHPVSFGRLSPLRSPQSPDDAACVKAVRTACKERLTRQQEVFQLDEGQAVADLQQSAQAVEGLVKLTKSFAAAFRAEKEKRRVLDFSDLEHETLALLYQRGSTEITGAAREIGRQFREVLVDEYQDTNAVQDSIFAALTRERGNCFLVGDVKQSIYRFRLADPGIFLEKYRQFVPAAQAQAGQGRKILLSENFRSGGEILEAANWVFGCCMYPEVGGLRYGPEESLREGVAMRRCRRARWSCTASSWSRMRRGEPLKSTRWRPSLWPGEFASCWTSRPWCGAARDCGRCGPGILPFCCVPPAPAGPTMQPRWPGCKFRQ